MTKGIKSLALSLLQVAGGFRVARRLARYHPLVLTYHHVLPHFGDAGCRRPANAVYVDEFERQLLYLSRHAHIVSGDELRAHIRGRALPPHSVLITFDDGYRNNYRYAFPLLKRHGATAVFFLTSDFIGDRRQRLWFDRLDTAMESAPAAVTSWLRTSATFAHLTLDEFRQRVKRISRSDRDALVAEIERASARAGHFAFSKDRVEPMTWEEVREMAGAGMLIGAHTASHQLLAHASAQEVMSELASCRDTIQANTGCDCWCFSYPNGEATDFSARDALRLHACGFECAFTQIPGFADLPGNRYTLPRLAVPSTADFRVFLTRATGLLPLLARCATV